MDRVLHNHFAADADSGVSDSGVPFSLTTTMKRVGVAVAAGVIASLVAWSIITKKNNKTMLWSKKKQWLVIILIYVVVAVGGFLIAKNLI